MLKPPRRTHLNSARTAAQYVLASATPDSPPTLGERLKSYGFAGVLSYGLLNTACVACGMLAQPVPHSQRPFCCSYYSVAFLFAWTTIVQAPHGKGVAEAAQAFVKTFALVWAGSQVTKPLRAAIALVLAPAAKLLLAFVQALLPSRSSEGAAFGVCVLACVTIAAALFAGVVLMSA